MKNNLLSSVAFPQPFHLPKCKLTFIHWSGAYITMNCDPYDYKRYVEQYTKDGGWSLA